jgi:hypothetical protein
MSDKYEHRDLGTGERIFYGVYGVGCHVASLFMHGSIIGIVGGKIANATGNACITAAIEGKTNDALEDMARMDPSPYE